MSKAFHGGVPVSRGPFSQGAVDDRKQRPGVVQRKHPRGHQLLVVPQEQGTLRYLLRFETKPLARKFSVYVRTIILQIMVRFIGPSDVLRPFF